MSLVSNSVCELPDIISAIVSFVSEVSLCEGKFYFTYHRILSFLKKTQKNLFLNNFITTEWEE